MTRLFHVRTSQGTWLTRLEDGSLGHATPEAMARARLAPLVGASFGATSYTASAVWLLQSPGAPAAPVLAFAAEPGGDGFALRQPGGEACLGAAPAGEDGTGGLSFSAQAGQDSLLCHKMTPDMGAPSATALQTLPDDFSFDGAGLRSLLEAADAAAWPVVSALLPTLSVSEVRAAWSATNRTVSHDAIHADIRAHGKAGLQSFHSYTADVLRGYASQFGWSIGEKSYGSPLIFEPSLGKLTIGRYCSMADPRIILGNHVSSSATTYPFLTLWFEWPGTYVGLDDHVARDVVIGNDVWTGVGATILPGAVIGDGCIIAAGAVVGGTIPPYSICTGVPARVKRKRFDDRTIERLLALQWWNWPDAVVDRYIPLLLNPDVQPFLNAAEAEFGVPHKRPKLLLGG